jgi:hypothetical protein
MKTSKTTFVTAALVLAAASALSADKVRLRSGKVVEGAFLGADSKTVRLLLDNGSRVEFPVGDVASLDFDERKPPPPPPPPPDPAVAPKPVMVPAGTVLNVRLTQPIDVDASQAGMKFKAVVDDPVMINGKVVIPRGASAALQAAKVQQSGNMKGADKITLKVNTIGFGGRVYEVATTYVEASGKGEGKRTGRKIGGGAGLGAIVGGIAGGGEGAAIGALVGGVGGAAIAAGGEEHLKLEAETRLQFQLASAVSIQP